MEVVVEVVVEAAGALVVVVVGTVVVVVGTLVVVVVGTVVDAEGTVVVVGSDVVVEPAVVLVDGEGVSGFVEISPSRAVVVVPPNPASVGRVVGEGSVTGFPESSPPSSSPVPSVSAAVVGTASSPGSAGSLSDTRDAPAAIAKPEPRANTRT